MKYFKFFLPVLFIAFFSLHAVTDVHASNHVSPPADTGDTSPPSDTGDVSPAADAAPNGGTLGLTNPLGSSVGTIPLFFRAIIEIILIFAVPFIVFFIIYAGFMYVTARGNAEAVKKAHNALLYALIGGVLILGANVLLTVITGTVNEIR